MLIVSLGITTVAQPRARFLKLVHNFGTFSEESGLARCKFALVNDGTSPLTILSARATCGCTTPEYSRKPIAPGDTAYISVAYDPSMRPGRFSKQIVVETNGTPSKARLEIKGVVIGSESTIKGRYPNDFGPLKLAWKNLALGEATMNHMKTVYLEGYNRSDDSLSVKFENVPPYINIVSAPEIVPPGEQVTFIAYVTPKKGTPYGLVEDDIMIMPAPGLRFKLPFFLSVKEDFSNLDAERLEKSPIAALSTDRVELGKISVASEPISVKLRLNNLGKSDLLVRRVYSSEKGVTAKIGSSAIKKGKYTDITVDIDPKMLDGSMVNCRLNIITNDPLQPVQTVRLVGEWIDKK